jgi:hypothetical protein
MLLQFVHERQPFAHVGIVHHNDLHRTDRHAERRLFEEWLGLLFRNLSEWATITKFRSVTFFSEKLMDVSVVP